MLNLPHAEWSISLQKVDGLIHRNKSIPRNSTFNRNREILFIISVFPYLNALWKINRGDFKNRRVNPSKGVIHRDLAARNCLLETKGGRLNLKIADFGLSKAVDNIYKAEMEYRKGF